MDANRFDGLTRAMGAKCSRRWAPVTALGAALATTPVVARCREDGGACKKGGQCYSGLCAPPTGSTAKGGVCCTPACSGRVCGGDGCGGSCGECTAPATCGGGATAGSCGTPGTVCTPSGEACDPNALVMTCCSKICQRDGYEGKECPNGDPDCCL
jgi:hypothetical protein